MFQATLLLVSALLFALGILRPREKAKDSSTTKVYHGQQFEFVVRSFAYICCVSLWLSHPAAPFSHAHVHAKLCNRVKS